MKRLYAIILTLAMIFALSACKDSSAPSGSGPSSGTDLTPAQIEKILEEMEKEEAKGE